MGTRPEVVKGSNAGKVPTDKEKDRTDLKRSEDQVRPRNSVLVVQMTLDHNLGEL
jgi:hypothetical protein